VKRVLIVDDEAGIRGFLAEVIQMNGWSAAEAAGVTQALALLQPGAFDLVVCDLLMPGPPWTQIPERIKSWGAGAVPMVLISGSGFISERDGAEFPFIVGRVQKPFSVEEIVGVLKRVLA
jgi:DNA-binding NtrC family response regulator